MNVFNRRQFLKTLCMGAAGALGAGGMLCAAPPHLAWAAGKAASKPNIVLILTDDQGWSDSSLYGSRFYHTPNMERLAREGLMFTDAYAAPVCSPTRAAIMTGRSPARLHLTHITQFINPTDTKLLGPTIRPVLPLQELTIAEELKSAGYVTASIGKWHLGDGEFEPQHQGFDVNVAGNNQGQPPDYYYPYKRTIASGQTFELGHLPGGHEGEYLTDRITDEALHFVEANKARPFFLYMAHFSPHTSTGARLQADEKLIDKYKATANTADPQHDPVYAAMLENLDANVGRLLDKLDALKLTDNTLVIFVSDNGGMADSTSNVPLRGAKGALYEGGIRVPMMVRWPGVVKPGSVSHTPVISEDLWPTLVQVARAQVPAHHALDSVSLLPEFKRPGTLQRGDLHWHFPHYTGPTTPCSAIRSGDYKLIEFYDDGHVELYNLKDDIAEKHDLAAKMPGRAAALRGRLDSWLKAVGAQLPVPNPDFK